MKQIIFLITILCLASHFVSAMEEHNTNKSLFVRAALWDLNQPTWVFEKKTYDNLCDVTETTYFMPDQAYNKEQNLFAFIKDYKDVRILNRSNGQDKLCHISIPHDPPVRVKLTKPEHRPICIALDSDASYIAVGYKHTYLYGKEPPPPIPIIQIYNCTTGIQTTQSTESSDYVTALAWSPEGQHLASGAKNGAIQLWNFKPTKTIVYTDTLHKHAKKITALAYLNNTKLVSASEDCTIAIWDLVKKQPIQTITPDYPVEAFGVHPSKPLFFARSKDIITYSYEQ